MGWLVKGISGLGVLNDNGWKWVFKIDLYFNKILILFGKLEIEI